MMRVTAFLRALSLALVLAACGASQTPPAQAADNYSITNPGNIFLRSNELPGNVHQATVGIGGGTDATEGNKAEVTPAGALKTDSSHVTQPVSFAGNFLVDTELPAPAELADNTANPTIPFVAGFNMVWDGATWDRWTGQVIPPSPSATTNYFVVRCTDGSVFVDCGGAGGGGGGTSSNFGSAFPAPGTAVGFSDGTNMRPGRAVDADTGVGTAYVQQNMLVKSASGGPVELGTQTDPVRTDPTGTTTQPAGGDVENDTADAGNPVKIGGKAVTADPTAVTVNDRVNAQFDTLGVQVTRAYRPDALVSGCGNATGTGDTLVIAAPGAGKRIYITDYSVDNESSTNTAVIFKSAATSRWRVPAPANFGGAVTPLNSPLRLGDDEAANFASVSGVTTMHVCFSGFVASN